MRYLTLFLFSLPVFSQIVCVNPQNCNSNVFSLATPVNRALLDPSLAVLNLPNPIANIYLNGLTAPSSAPTLTLGSAGALTGTYYYGLSAASIVGPTESGTLSAVISLSAQRVTVSGFPSCAVGQVGFWLWRTTNGGNTTQKKLVTKLNCSQANYIDNTIDGSLGVGEPSINTSGATIYGGSTVYVGFGKTSTVVGESSYPSGLGVDNTVFGATNFLFSTAAATDNTLGGFAVFQGNPASGTYNSAWGSYGLNANTSGSANSCIGAFCLSGNTSGSYNSGLGQNACSNLTTGSFVTCIGRYSQSPSATSNNVIVLGTSAETVRVSGQCFSQLATDGTTVMWQSVTNVGVATWSSTKPGGCN